MKRITQLPFRWTFKQVTLGLALLLVLLAIPTSAFADQVVNNIDTTIDPALETRTITVGGSTIVGFFIQPSNIIPAGDANGCNATGANPATVTLSVPAGVIASPSPLTFTGCGIVQNVTFSSSTLGSHTISVASITGGKSGSLWGTASASFTLIVNPPADTTPPVITANVTGTLGNNGWYVSDVTVSWSVTDPESAITSTSGCGSTTINADTPGQTLTCSATSIGGTNSQSVTIKRDATAPTISGSASPAPNGAGWNNTDVTVSFTCADNLSGVASCGPDQTLSGEGAGQSASGTAIDNAGNSASATVGGINIDKTAPTISGSASPAPNANGWNNGDVTVSFTCGDSLSGVVSCGPNQTLSSEGANQSASGTAVDNAGNSTSATVSSINIDKSAPTVTVTGVTNGATYTLGSVPAAGCSTTDALSGVATSASLSTSGGPVVGTFIATCSGASDNAGNNGSASATYNVIYNWNGFFRPVDNLPTLNQVKAGSAIPVKFSLNGNQGLNIFTAGYPKSQKIDCDTSASIDNIEETVTAGSSSLSYDPTADQYNYVWKTDKAWGGTCRQLTVMLNDGTSHMANFNFTK